jgi:hypothetical protein
LAQEYGVPRRGPSDEEILGVFPFMKGREILQTMARKQ